MKQTNTTQFPIQTHYNVSGIPGHTHNASAVVSITADYTKTRAAAITISENAWGPGQIIIPAAVPEDSAVPEDFEERADRVIERGIGTIAMAPENCNSFISEPTRSISEIRTLVCPSYQLDTLTYVEGGLAGRRARRDHDAPHLGLPRRRRRHHAALQL